MVKTGGLAGVVAGDSAICLCGVEEQSLRYRGYSIEDLAEHTSFEEVAWLLLRGELPSTQELAAYTAKLKSLRSLPSDLEKPCWKRFPPMPMKWMSCVQAVLLLGNLEPETDKTPPFAIADRLLACLGSMLLYCKAEQIPRPTAIPSQAIS